LSEEHVEVANTLLDVSDLLLSFDDEGLVEIDVVLSGETCEFLLLQLLFLGAGRDVFAGGLRFVGCSRRANGCSLFLEGGPLEVLELFEGVLELGRDLIALILLLFLRAKLVRN
jgi:hypothetical protein